MDIIEKARKALQNGKRKVDGFNIFTSKIDLDCKLDIKEKQLWENTRAAIIKAIGGTIIDIITYDTDRGCHTIINWLGEKDRNSMELNIIQLCLGDDQTRFKINRGRIERGISWEEGNILFSRVLKRFGTERESKLKIAVERIVGEI